MSNKTKNVSMNILKSVKEKSLYVAAVLAVGVAMSGYFVYRGISKYAEKDRCVTVKGLSEREVLANRVTWPMSIALEGNDLQLLLKELIAEKDTVMKFLSENGMENEELSVSVPDIADRSEYDDYKKGRLKRYRVSLDVTINSKKVQEVTQLMNLLPDLYAKGVCVSSEDYRIQYDYVDLSNLKPTMVEEATKDARKVAEKFALDAECSLGSIINATQGTFSIEDNYHRPQYKQIRVVTTVSYYLK